MTDVERFSTARSGGWKPLRNAVLLAGSVVTVLVTALLPAARPAGADPLSSDRAQAAQVNAVLLADQAKLDALAQQYELAQQQLSSIDAQVAQVRATIAGDEGVLRDDALAAYESGAEDSGLSEFAQGGEQAAATAEYSTLATSDMTTAVDDLHNAQGRLAAEQSQLEASEAQIASARAAAQATTNAEAALLHSLNSAIAKLLQPPPPAVSALGPIPPGVAGAAIRAAESQIGVPYEWGGESPGHGFDCSGLVQWAFGQAGVGLPRTATAQMDATARVPLSAMEPGDLVFWGSGSYAQHVAIYLGNGEVIDAPATGQDVQIQHIWSGGLLTAGRV